MCLYGPHKDRGMRNFFRDCLDCPKDKRKELFKKLFENNSKTGPFTGLRSRPEKSNEENKMELKSTERTVGRLAPKSRSSLSPSIKFTSSNEISPMTACGRTDDGNNESIVSPKLAEKAVLNGIEKMTKFDKVCLQVALKNGSSAETFFSPTWTPPCVVLKLISGPLALVNVTFLVVDADLFAEGLSIGLPVLQHLGVNTKTLLEQRRDALDGSDCSSVSKAISGENGGYVRRLMVARTNRDEEPLEILGKLPNSHALGLTTSKFGTKSIRSRMHLCLTQLIVDRAMKCLQQSTK